MRPRSSFAALIATGAVLLAASPALAVEVDVHGSPSQVTIFDDGGVQNAVTVTYGGGSVTVTDTAVAPTAAFMSDCDALGNTVTCPVVGTPTATAVLDEGNDTIVLNNIQGTAIDGGPGNDNIQGGELADTLSGGDGNDTIRGGGGADILQGNAGNDDIDGQEGADFTYWDEGGDHIHDSGTSGQDAVTYFYMPDENGVEVTLDGVADDGNFVLDAGGTDNIDVGIDHVQGTQFSDELQGGPAGDYLSGAGGDDLLVGNGGTDTFNGAEGNDRIEARDGAADAAIDCDNSMGAHGTADVAVVDADDPAAANCETVDRPAGGGGGGGGGGTVVAPPPPPGPAGPAGSTILKVEETHETVTMPNVVGQKIDPARRAILQKATGVDLDVVFQQGCKESQDQEVIRQRPAKGTKLDTFVGADLPVRLYVCIAERDFMADCDLKDLRGDLKELPKRTDADLGLAFLGKFGKCKVDYDIKLAKQAEEARIALEAQQAREVKLKADADARVKAEAEKQARSKKAQIKAAIECPTAPEDQDLTITLTEGAVATSGRFGLRESGPDGWTIPVGAAGGYTSYIDMLIRDKGAPVHAVEATVYMDGEDAGVPMLDKAIGSASPQRVVARNGYARFVVTPNKPGKIRFCAVYRTGDDQALTAALEVRVVGPLKVGDSWTTVSGRRLDITKNGPKEQFATARAHKAGLDQVWDFLVGLFGGTSRSINQQAASEGTIRAKKLVSIQSRYAAAQVTLDGTLDPDPKPPTVQRGPCDAFQADGRVVEITCPQLVATGGSALLGMSTDGARLVAAGAGNVLSHNGGALVAAGAGNVLSHNGGAIVAAGSLNGKGSTLVAAGAGNAISPAVAQLVGTDGGSLIGTDGASLIGTDGASMRLAGPAGIVAAGSLN